MQRKPSTAVPARFTGGARALARMAIIATIALAGPDHRPAAADANIVIGGAAGTISPLLGLNIGPHGNLSNPDLTAAYQARGIRLVRTHDYYGPLDMATLYPDRSRPPLSQSSYNFTGVFSADGRSSDTTFGSIISGGFEPYFRLGDSFNNVTAPASSELANWVQAAVQVMRHYREGQWSGFTSSFRYVEIWNEPNGSFFWPLTRNQYFTLYAQTAAALRSAFPSLKIGGPGVNPAGCKVPSGQQWVRDFLDVVRAAGAPLDFFSWHLYTNDPSEYATCAAFFRSELDSRGFTATEQHVSEWNTESATGAAGIELRAMARGAAINTAAWIAMQQSGVAQETFYRGPEPDPNAPYFYGMFRANGQPKRVGLAAELWYAMTGYATRRSVTGTASDFYALAGANSAGALAILVANTSNAVRTWSLSTADGVPDGTSYTVKTVSDDASTIQTSTTASATFTIPAYGVQLVIAGSGSQTFTASATPNGSPSALTLDVTYSPDAADIGATGNTYIAAVSGSTYYFLTAQGWQRYSGGEYLVYSTGPLPASQTIRVFSATDVRPYRGLPIYVAYGRSAADMLARGLYRLVYTL